MRIRVLIILGHNGEGRQAVDLLPDLNPTWEAIYVGEAESARWIERNGLTGPLHVVPKKGTRVLASLRAMCRVAWLMLRLRPHAVLSVRSALSLPAMAIGRLMACRRYYVEPPSQVHPSGRPAQPARPVSPGG